jgi:hypothetical protein
MSHFRPIDRQTSFLLPPSVDDWLPQKHLARFVVELIDSLDVSAMSGVSRFGFGESPPVAFIGHFGLRLRHGRFFQPQAGAGDL